MRFQIVVFKNPVKYWNLSDFISVLNCFPIRPKEPKDNPFWLQMEPQPEEDKNKLDLSPSMEEAWLEVAMYYKHLLMFGDLPWVNLLCPELVNSCQVGPNGLLHHHLHQEDGEQGLQAEGRKMSNDLNKPMIYNMWRKYNIQENLSHILFRTKYKLKSVWETTNQSFKQIFGCCILWKHEPNTLDCRNWLVLTNI